MTARIGYRISFLAWRTNRCRTTDNRWRSGPYNNIEGAYIRKAAGVSGCIGNCSGAYGESITWIMR